MKIPWELLSVMAIAWLIFALLRLPLAEVPGSLLRYLVCQGSFTLLAWAAQQRLDLHDAKYAALYFAPLAAVLGLAVYLTTRFCGSYPFWLSIPASAVFAVSLSFIIGHELLKAYRPGSLPLELTLMLLASTVFLVCGVATLVSLAERTNDIQASIRAGLGMFWLFQGAFHFAYSLGIVRSRLAWTAHADFLPSAVTTAIFLLLALHLTFQQAELSQSPVASSAAAAPAIVEDAE